MTNKSIRDYINLIENIQQEVTEGTDREVTHNGEVIGHTWNQGNEVHGEHSKSGASWAGGNHAAMAQHIKNQHDAWVKQQARKKEQEVTEGTDNKVIHNGKVIGTVWRNGKEVQGEHTKSGMSWAGGTPESMAQHLKNHHDSWVKHQAWMKKHGKSEEQLEETSPEAIDKINQITRK